MIIPVELAANAKLFILETSETKHISLDQLKARLQIKFFFTFSDV